MSTTHGKRHTLSNPAGEGPSFNMRKLSSNLRKHDINIEGALDRELRTHEAARAVARAIMQGHKHGDPYHQPAYLDSSLNSSMRAGQQVSNFDVNISKTATPIRIGPEPDNFASTGGGGGDLNSTAFHVNTILRGSSVKPSARGEEHLFTSRQDAPYKSQPKQSAPHIHRSISLNRRGETSSPNTQSKHSQKSSENMLFKRIERPEQQSMKASIMSNSGIIKVPQRSRQMRQESLTFYGNNTSWSDQHNYRINFTHSAGSAISQVFSGVDKDLTPTSLQKSPVPTPPSQMEDNYGLDQLEMLEELPEHDTQKNQTEREQRRTIKMLRKERSRRNTARKQAMTIQSIAMEELELEKKMLELGKTDLPTMINCNMNIDDQGLAEHFYDGRNDVKKQETETMDDQDAKHPNVLDDSFVQIDVMNPTEKLRVYKDKYLCLKCRKKVMKFRLMIVECCETIMNSSFFENLVLFMIIANSISMIFEDPTVKTQVYPLEVLDRFFLAFYTLEMIIKVSACFTQIFAMGLLFNKKAYLRDPWNILDFVIVVSAYITILLQNSTVNLNVLRSFRVLRPLKTASRLEGLRIIISALVAALPLLIDTIWILLFFFLLFAIAGLQLFQGALRNRCLAPDGSVHVDDHICGGAYTCPSGFTCTADVHNPAGGVNNFDNIFNSLITVFQCVTLEGWGSIMDNLWNSSNVTATIFFVPLVFIGAFFLLNLTLAVIKSKFTDAHTKKKKKRPEPKVTKDIGKLRNILSALMRMKFIVRRWVKKIRDKKHRHRLLFERRGTVTFSHNSPNPSDAIPRKDIIRLQTDDSDAQELSFSSTRSAIALKAADRRTASADPGRRVPSRLTAISEEFPGILGDLSQQRVHLVSGNKRLVMSGIAAPSARKAPNVSTFKAMSSIQSSPRSESASSPASDRIPSSDLIQSSIPSLARPTIQVASPRPALFEDPESPVLSEEEASPPKTPVRKEESKLASPAKRNALSADNVVKKKQSKKQIMRRAMTMPSRRDSTAGPLTTTGKEETMSQASSKIEKDFFIFNSPHKRLGVFKKFKNSYQSNTRGIEGMLRKFEQNRASVLLDQPNTMNETVQSLDQLKQLDNDFAKRLKNAHFVISQDDYFSSSYVDVINTREALLVAKARRKKKSRPATRSIFSEPPPEDDDEIAVPQNHEDDGRLGRSLARRKSIDFLGKQQENASPVRWRPSRSRASLRHSSHRQNSITLFRPQARRKKIKQPAQYKRKQRYVIDVEAAEVQDYLNDQEEDKYENLAPYYLRISNSILVSGSSQINFVMKQQFQQEVHRAAHGGVDMSFQEDQKRQRPYHIEEEKNIQIDFLKQRVREIQAGYHEHVVSQRLQQSMRLSTLPEISEMPISSVSSPRGDSVAGIGAFSQLNSERSSKLDDKRRKFMRKMKQLNLNSAQNFSTSSNFQSLSARDASPCSIRPPGHSTPLSRGSSEPEFSKFKTNDAKGGGGRHSPRERSSSTSRPRVKPLFDPRKRNQIPSIFASEAPPIFEEEKTYKSGDFSSLPTRRRHQSLLMNFEEGTTSRPGSSEASYPALIPQIELNQKQQEIFINSFKEQPPSPKHFDSHQQRQALQQRIRDQKYAKKKLRLVEWSGQDVFQEMPRNIAKFYTGQLTQIRVGRKGCPGRLEKFKNIFKTLVSSSLFENFMIICVTINTVTLAMDHYGISASLQKTLTDMNLVFTIIFCIEMGLKLIGLSIVGYFLDTMNYLDGAVVILSIVQITVFNTGNNAISAFRTVRIFRTFRVLRVARLLRSLKSMHQIISVIGRSLSSFAYLALLLFLFMFIYTLLGIQLFGNIKSSSFFSDFLSAFMSTFQVMTLENWQDLLYATAPEAGTLSTLYFVSWIFIGNFILLNLFLAILLDSFNQQGNQQEEAKKEEQAVKLKSQKAVKKKKGGSPKKKPARSNKKSSASNPPASQRLQVPASNYSSSSALPVAKNKSLSIDNRRGSTMKVPPRATTTLSLGKKRKGSNFHKGPLKRQPSILGKDFDEDELATMKAEDIKQKQDYNQAVACEYSLFIFPKKSKCRFCFFNMQKHYWFERVIMLLIMLSTLKLIYDTYTLDSTGISKVVSDQLDLFFTIIFTLEALIKSIALGFALDRGSYLTEDWNKLDFFIVVTSLLDLALFSIDIPAVRVLRILRTLRPLRLISHNSQMKIVVTALIQSTSGILNVVIVVVIVWLMFAILGVSVFAGKFGICTSPAGVELYDLSKNDCEAGGNSFIHYDSNFNNVIRAMLTLFIVASLQGWPNIKDIANRGQDPDISLCEGHCAPYNGLYFVFFILIGSFFFLNLFVGVIFLNFEQTQKLEKANIQVKDQHWMTMQQLILKAKPELDARVNSKNCVRAALHRLVTHFAFQAIIIVCIILNMVQMAISYYGAPGTYVYALQLINYIFTAVFTLEAILKLIPYGLLYFKSSWNVFDFIVVIGSLLDIILNSLDQSSLRFLRVGPQLARVLRVLRVTRLLRLVNRLKGLQLLIQTIIFSVGALIHVFMLLMILFFIYSILGVFLFSDITGGQVISELNNFSNFGYAMLTLLRISTGEDWHVIMYDTMHGAQCKNGVANSCAVVWSPIYFISFVVLCTLVVLNLFILVILQQFETYYLPENNLLNKFKEELETFNSIWTKHSREYKGDMINSESANRVLKELASPLGTMSMIGKDEIFFMLKLNLQTDSDGRIHFHEMLYKIMKRAYGQKAENLKMLQIEIATLKAIRKRKNEAKKRYTDSTKSIMKNIKDQDKQKNINPLLIALYYNNSIKVWRKVLAKRKLLKENEEEDREEGQEELEEGLAEGGGGGEAEGEGEGPLV